MKRQLWAPPWPTGTVAPFHPWIVSAIERHGQPVAFYRFAVDSAAPVASSARPAHVVVRAGLRGAGECPAPEWGL